MEIPSFPLYDILLLFK